MFKNITQTIFRRKKIAVPVLLVILAGGYLMLGGKSVVGTTYVLAAVEKGTIVSSITGNGQVSVSDQVDIKPKASGEVTWVGIKNGQEVRAGQVLAYVDSRDAQRAIRDAQISLDSAKISLEKMKRNQDADGKTTTDSLGQSYKDAYSKVSDAFLDMPELVDLARGVLYDSTVAAGGCSNTCEYGNLATDDFRRELAQEIDRAQTDYAAAKSAFDPNFQAYRSVRLDASPEEVVSILTTTEQTVQLLGQAIKSEQNMIDALVSNIKDEATHQGHRASVPQQLVTYQNSIGSAISQLNGMLLGLSGARRGIESSQRSLDDSVLTDPIDIASQENTVKQRQAALQDAQVNLGNYVVRAPFAGTIAKVTVKKGDSVGSAALATLLAKQTIAVVSLNEVDASKVKVGQKATLMFDAVENLTLTGSVVEVDSLGTVSQGVVTYGVTIGFDTQDARIKPGMSVASAIITDVKQNVLMVPNAAVALSGDVSLVKIPQDPNAQQLMASATGVAGISLVSTPRQQEVQVGISNDSFTEIVSGLNEGDIVVARTVAPTTARTTTTTQNRNQSIFTGGGTGGGFRTQGR